MHTATITDHESNSQPLHCESNAHVIAPPWDLHVSVIHTAGIKITKLYLSDLEQLLWTNMTPMTYAVTKLSSYYDNDRWRWEQRSIFPKTSDWNYLDTLSRSKLIPQPPVDICCC